MKKTTSIILSLIFSASAFAKDISVTTPQELFNAVSSATPGDRITVKAGTYNFDKSLILTASGKEGSTISLLDDTSDAGRPLFDFSALPEKSASNGIVVKGNYWHIKGLDVIKAGHNGLRLQGGSNNLIEFCSFSQNFDTGLQISDGSANNIILNCDSYENADAKKENADGFACKMDVGNGNKFIGCRAWNNMDDGWDGYLRNTDNISTSYENCWAFRNGISKEGVVSGGDGNGFKTGGSDEKTLKHNAVYKNCIAAGNVADGFDHNSNRGEVTLLNCAAHNNKRNFGFSKTSPLSKLTIKNSIVLGTPGNIYAEVTDLSNNSWQLGLALSDKEFRSTEIKELLKPRKADGTLPEIAYLYPAEGSALVDKGVNVGLPFNSSAPDLGVFELSKK